jgi:hypothetical protein
MTSPKAQHKQLIAKKNHAFENLIDTGRNLQDVNNKAIVEITPIIGVVKSIQIIIKVSSLTNRSIPNWISKAAAKIQTTRLV